MKLFLKPEEEFGVDVFYQFPDRREVRFVRRQLFKPAEQPHSGLNFLLHVLWGDS